MHIFYRFRDERFIGKKSVIFLSFYGFYPPQSRDVSFVPTVWKFVSKEAEKRVAGYQTMKTVILWH